MSNPLRSSPHSGFQNAIQIDESEGIRLRYSLRMATEPTEKGRIRWLETRGQKVLLLDLSYCSGDTLLSLIRNAALVIRAQPPQSTLVLADFTGVEWNADLVALIKKVASLDQPHIKRSAWVGSDALSQLWHAAIERVSKRTFHRFETREEALTFLLQE